MSLSLPPPPRRNTTPGHTTTAPRYPKINPNSLAASDPSLDPSEEDENLDRALAELLGEAHITPQLPSTHISYKRHNTAARPLSIASISTHSSGSYSSNHSRRVSQAYLSPLSPTPSEPPNTSSGSYFSRLAEDEEYGYPATTGESTQLSLEQDMALSASSFPSCTYCPSIRSNSICSSCTHDDRATIGHSSTTSTTAVNGLESLTGNSSRDIQGLDSSSRLQALKEYIPTEIRCRLNFHLDECWFMNFSPTGEYMMSTSLDNSVILWVDYLTLEPKVHNSFQFSRSVTEVEWSPDGKYMLVNLGIDLNHLNYSPRLNLIEVASGETVIVQKESEGTRNINASGIGWLMDSKRFLTFQPDGTAYVWNLNGDITQEFDLDLKIHTCKMVPGQDAAIVSTKDGKVVIFTLEDGQIRLLTTLEDQPTAMRISPDLHYVALPMKSDKNLCRQAQILILDFHSGTLLRTLASESFFNEDFVIMPSFFGPNYTILCTGSENGTVNYWDIETGEFIMAREEHSQHTGSTVFHPSIPGFMASCGDDCHIFLWVTKDLGRELQEEDEKWLNSRRNSVLPIDIKKGW